MAHVDADAARVTITGTLFVPAGTTPAEPLRLGRGRVERLTGQARGADALVVDRMTIDPGTPRGPFHVHRHTSNTLVVLDGELEVRVPGGSHRLRTGDAIFLSAGHPHGTHNPGDGRVSVLVIYERTVDDDFDLAPEEPTQQVADLG